MNIFSFPVFVVILRKTNRHPEVWETNCITSKSQHHLPVEINNKSEISKTFHDGNFAVVRPLRQKKKGRENELHVQLKIDKITHMNTGQVHHNDVIGSEPGKLICTNTGQTMCVLFPTMEHFVKKWGSQDKATKVLHLAIFLLHVTQGHVKVLGGYPKNYGNFLFKLQR